MTDRELKLEPHQQEILDDPTISGTVKAAMLRFWKKLAEVEQKAGEPHAYSPSSMHMGDCYVCGHLQGAAIHRAKEPKETP